MSLLVECRSNKKIPYIFHFIWFQGSKNIPDKYNINLQSFRKHHPNWEFKFWDESMIIDLLKKEYPKYLIVYNNYPKMIQKIDAAKYFILDHFGGIYCDLDAICIQNVESIISGYTLIFSRMNISKFQKTIFQRVRNYDQYYNNHFIASISHHPFWSYLHTQLQNELDIALRGSDQLLVIDSTGPYLLSKHLSIWRKQQLKNNNCNSYKSFHCSYFDPINCFTERDLTCEDTCIIHYSDGNWVSWQSRAIIYGMGTVEIYGLIILLLLGCVLALLIYYCILRYPAFKKSQAYHKICDLISKYKICKIFQVIPIK